MKRIIHLLFFTVIVLMTFPASFASAAEKTIGVIMNGDIPYYQELHSSFMTRLAKEGHRHKTEVIVQKPYPDSISLSNASRKLIAAEVDVIIAYGAPAAVAVINEKSNIPLVYAAAYEPYLSHVRMKNSTGINMKLSISSLLRYLRSIVPISTLGVIYNSNEEDSLFQFREVSKLSTQYGFRIEGINIKRHQDAKSLLTGLKIDAILITGSSAAHMALPAITDFSRERKIPFGSFMYCRDSHAVVTLASSPAEQGEKAAEKVMRILDGTPPEKLRIETAKDIELIFNLRESTAMGWKLPMELVTEATKIIK